MKVNVSTLELKPQQPKKEYSTWNSNPQMQTRKRKGLHPISSVYSPNIYNGIDSSLAGYPYRQLTYEQMWTIYVRCADVRACVDSIVRRVATYDWFVRPVISPNDPDFQKIDEACKKIRNFLNKPNSNNETWQELMTALLTDTLVYDTGIIELVKNRQGELTELVALDASTVEPIVDEFGKIKGYVQTPFDTGGYFPQNKDVAYVDFKKDQILQLSIYKNTKNPTGNPLLEALVNEVVTLIRSSEHVMYALDADEIPPGILVLSGIGGSAAREAQADLQRLKSQDHKIRVMTTPDPSGIGAKWLELRHTPKDLELRSIVEDVKKTVFRTYGVMPVEMGMTDGMPRATASVQLDVSSSHLVTPMVELIQAKINNIIMPLLVEDKELLEKMTFGFDREAKLTTQEQLQLASANTSYVKTGVLTRNEVRKTLGLLPELGGDILSFDSNLGPIPVSTLTEGGSAILVGQNISAPSEPNPVSQEE